MSLNWGKSFEINGEVLVVDQNNETGLNYYGPRGTIPTYSLTDAYNPSLEGRTVFIGATAEGFGDTFPTPFDRNMPGVEALATMFANITAKTNLRRDDLTWSLDILLAVLAVIACVWAASRGRAVAALTLTLLVWGAAASLLQIAFLQSLWLDGATLILVLTVATICGGGARWLIHRKSARNLAQYQSPMLAEVLADRAHPIFDGRIQKAAALFVDAADFTARTCLLYTSDAADE